jgi:hypothetical protein
MEIGIGWKLESDGNWVKIKYFVALSNVSGKEYLYFEYIFHKTLLLRFLYRKLYSGLMMIMKWNLILNIQNLLDKHT